MLSQKEVKKFSRHIKKWLRARGKLVASRSGDENGSDKLVFLTDFGLFNIEYTAVPDDEVIHEITGVMPHDDGE